MYRGVKQRLHFALVFAVFSVAGGIVRAITVFSIGTPVPKLPPLTRGHGGQSNGARAGLRHFDRAPKFHVSSSEVGA